MPNAWPRLLLCAALCALSAAGCVGALADETHAAPLCEARELTAQCEFSAEGRHDPLRRLTDGDYRRPFEAPQGALIIRAPEGETIGALYLCFADMPAEWSLEEWTDGAWRAFAKGETDFAHVVSVVLDRQTVRVAALGEALRLNEARVFASGTLPPDVQRWEPPPEKVDLMLLVAHPDDEFLFFGGLIPWYVSQGRHVLVVYMTCRDSTRRAELLNGLWTAGVREYPLIGGFRDRSTRTLERMYDAWTRQEVDGFLIKLIRHYRPDVLVTHDVSGEYGHGAHRVCADAALRVFDKTADPMYMPQHSKAFGVWQVKKLYLHLYAQNQLSMDWTRAVGEETAQSLAQAGFQMHVSQQHFHMQVKKDARYDSSLFGLAKSTVGQDVRKDDFFEHIE